MPVVVRVVLPIAAGAMLVPLPSWSSGPVGGVREAIPIRVLLAQGAVREEGLLEGEIGLAGTDAEARISSATRSRTRVSTHPASAVATPSVHEFGFPLSWVFIAPPSGPDRYPGGWSPPNSPRAPPYRG